MWKMCEIIITIYDLTENIIICVVNQKYIFLRENNISGSETVKL